MAIAELATKISFIGNLSPLEKLNSGLDTAVKGITVTTAAFTAAGYAVHAFMQNTLRLADAQGQLARETGVSVEAIQEWGYAASVNGSSADAFQTSLSNLSKKIGETATKGSEDFNRLGISVRDSFGNVKSADAILKEVSQRFKELNLSKGQQADFLEKLGIDKSMIQTLNLSSNALANLRAEARALGVISQEETDQLIAYNDSMTTLRYGVDALQKKLAIAMIPQVQALSDGFIDLLKNNKGLIKYGIEKFTEAINIAYKVGRRFGTLLVDLFSDMTDGQKVVAGFVGSIYLLGKALKSPLVLFTAFLAVIDDLSVGLEGGKSVVADFFKAFNVDLLTRIPLLLGEFKVGFEQLSIAILSTFKYLGLIANFFGASFDVSGLENMISKSEEVIKNQRILNKEQYQKVLVSEEGIRQTNLNQNAMLPKAITNNSSSNVQQTNNMTFNIKSTDPIKAGEEIQKQMKNANTQFGVGGR